MKVICIDGVKIGDPAQNGFIAQSGNQIYEGEVYTVIDTASIGEIFGYKLQERDFGYYQAVRFMPISDLNETELIKERYDVLAY